MAFIGVLVGTTIRPNDELAQWPTAFSNELLGGLHTVADKTELYNIYDNRRQFGMIAYVISEKKYYSLVPNDPQQDVKKDTNWVELSIGGGGSGEWVDSVIGVYSDSTLGSAQNGVGFRKTGTRVLVAPTGTDATFDTFENQIAIYSETGNGNSGGYTYIEPTNGYTLRADNDPGVIYTFVGTSSNTGTWYKERQNILRYINPTSNDGKTFSFTTSDGTKPLLGYTYTVFLSSFGTANSGTASLSIDGNSYYPIKKVVNNSLTDLDANDFNAGPQYLITYSSNTFQIFLPSGGGGGTIGEAEDNNYGDGLYTDFTPSTPIGVPIDRFNQILKSLVPPQAPNLSSWNVESGLFANGNISYNSAQAAVLTPLAYEIVAFPPSEIGAVGQNGAFNSSGYRLGITPKTGSIGGKLNSGVAKNPNLPTAAYDQYAFGNGITGSVVLYINSKTASIVDLGSSLNSIIQSTSHGELNVTSATSSKFSNGTPFETFWWRTGQWTVNKGSSFINYGFNQIQVKHILPSTTYTLTKYEFLVDGDISTTDFPSAAVSDYTTGTKKFLSGIEYWTAKSFKFQVTVDNAYKNTYSGASDAIAFSDTSVAENFTIYNGVPRPTLSDPIAFSAASPNSALPTAGSVGQQIQPSSVYNLVSNRRKINGTSKLTLGIKRTVQAFASTNFSVGGWYIDTYPASSTNTLENFDDESYRLAVANWASTSGIGTGTWVSSGDLLNTYRNALQIADGRLLYPSRNFQGDGTADTNPNFGISARNYTNCKINGANDVHGANTRTYIRYFQFSSVKNVFTLNISASGTNFVKVNTGLSNTSNCYIEFKLPYSGSGVPGGPSVNTSTYGVTGWLDACLGYDNAAPIDGKGCLQGDVPGDYSGWVINFGPKSTLFSDGKVLVRITAGPNWNGFIESISLT